MTAGTAKQISIGAVLQTMIWTILGEIVGPTVVGAVVWRFGAGYTVLALQWITQAFTGEAQSGVLWYAVPTVFSAVELALWKLKNQMSPQVRRLAYGMAVFDLISTALGIFLAVTTSYMPRLGFTTQDIRHYAVAVLLAGVAAWWVTFSPEKYLVNALLQAFQIVRFVKMMRKGAPNGTA